MQNPDIAAAQLRSNVYKALLHGPDLSSGSSIAYFFASAAMVFRNLLPPYLLSDTLERKPHRLLCISKKELQLFIMDKKNENRIATEMASLLVFSWQALTCPLDINVFFFYKLLLYFYYLLHY